MSEKHDYPLMKKEQPFIKMLKYFGKLALGSVCIALAVCLITQTWTWEMFGKVNCAQVPIFYIVLEVYAHFYWLE